MRICECVNLCVVEIYLYFTCQPGAGWSKPTRVISFVAVFFYYINYILKIRHVGAAGGAGGAHARLPRARLRRAYLLIRIIYVYMLCVCISVYHLISSSGAGASAGASAGAAPRTANGAVHHSFTHTTTYTRIIYYYTGLGRRPHDGVHGRTH